MGWVCIECREENPSGDLFCVCGIRRPQQYEGSRVLGETVSDSRELVPDVMLVTTQELPGFKIQKVFGLVSSESVGKVTWQEGWGSVPKAASELVDKLSVGNFYAGKEMVRRLKQDCTDDLKRNADKMGANAVVAVNIQLSGSSVLSSGTAVLVGMIE